MSVISNNWLTEKNLTFPVLLVELWSKCLSLLLIKKKLFHVRVSHHSYYYVRSLRAAIKFYTSFKHHRM